MDTTNFKNQIMKGKYILLLLSMSSCNSCDNSIDLPQNDRTPPTYKWTVQVQNNNNDQYEYEITGQVLRLGKDYNYRVFFVAQDNDGGIKKVGMNGNALSACPQSTVMDIVSVKCQDNHTLSPDVTGKVQTSAFSFCTFDMKCKKVDGLVGQAFSGPGGTMRINGYAENYHGGNVSSTLTIVNDPALQ